MSITNLLSTSVCMVVIGVSAGPAFAQTSSSAQLTPTESTQSSQFVAASVTTWTRAESSDVAAPRLVLPVAYELPTPQLLRYGPSITNRTAGMSPDLPLFAHIDDAVIVAPDQLEAATSDLQTVRPQAQQIAVASASASVIAPGSSRRFRGQDESKVTGIEGFFKQLFTPRAALQPTQPRRPTPAANTRDDQGTDRIRRVWAIGVFR